jgi:ribosomal protein S18 acetylase RimI-like enzyme
VTLGDAPIATITIDEFADTDFWRPADEVRSALYVHRMAVSREYTGLGVGSAMLDWASTYAMARNRRYLRLDAWRSNLALREYYRDQHFTLVRICRRQDRGSGALFQRPTDLELHQGPTLNTPVQ